MSPGEIIVAAVRRALTDAQSVLRSRLVVAEAEVEVLEQDLNRRIMLQIRIPLEVRWP